MAILTAADPGAPKAAPNRSRDNAMTKPSAVGWLGSGKGASHK